MLSSRVFSICVVLSYGYARLATAKTGVRRAKKTALPPNDKFYTDPSFPPTLTCKVHRVDYDLVCYEK